MQLRTNRNTQADVICNDVWLTSTVTYHHNYDCDLCYSYFWTCTHDSSQGLCRPNWTRCQVEYYNEQKINNSSRSINRGIFVFALNPITALLLSMRVVWSGQRSRDSSVSSPDEQISLTVSGHLVMLVPCAVLPRGLLVLCVKEHASSWKGFITIGDSRSGAEEKATSTWKGRDITESFFFSYLTLPRCVAWSHRVHVLCG